MDLLFTYSSLSFVMMSSVTSRELSAAATGRRENVTGCRDDHSITVFYSISVEELLDGIADIVHHNLLFFSDFLLLLICVSIEIIPLLVEFLSLNFSCGTEHETLVHLLLERIHIILEFVASSVHLFLDALYLGFYNRPEVVCHIIVSNHLVEVEIYDGTVGNNSGFRIFCTLSA